MNNNANHTLLFENDIIKDVNFMPSPVIAKTPIIKEAHKIIEAIKEICLPHKLQAFLNLSNPTLISNFVFRLKNNQAIINRLGFNNDGFEIVKKRLSKIGKNNIGVNIGANKNSEDFINDYLKGIEFFSSVASYLTINISSPNTPGLRDLEAIENFGLLLSGIDELRSKSKDIKLPILIKISPDINQDDLEILCERVLSSSVDGLIISNTTISRYSIDSSEAGGLSGQPIFDSSTSTLNKVYKYTEGKIPLIGVGGIDSAEKAYKKIKNGASLIQLYTGLVYKGPKLITEINKGLIKFIEKDGFNNISEAVGVEVN